jgi:hypothetical protein
MAGATQTELATPQAASIAVAPTCLIHPLHTSLDADVFLHLLLPHTSAHHSLTPFCATMHTLLPDACLPSGWPHILRYIQLLASSQPKSPGNASCHIHDMVMLSVQCT